MGVGTNGLAITDNGGVTWRTAPLPFANADLQSTTGVSVSGKPLFFVATQRGVFETEDFGATWKQMAMPIMKFDGVIISAKFDQSTRELSVYGINADAQLIAYRRVLEEPSTNVRFEINRQAGLIQVHRLSLSNDRQIGTLLLELAERAKPQIKLYNNHGIKVLTLYDAEFEAGEHQINLDFGSLPSSNYFLTVEAKGNRVVQPVIIVR